MNIKKKLLKNFIVQNILGLIASIYIYIVKTTSQIKYENKLIPESYWKNNKPFILAFWHNQLMMITFSWKAEKKLNILASGHSDGRLGSIIAKYLKSNNIQTSNKEKNITLRPIFKILKNKNSIAITPDGPRGPKENVSEGIIKIAKTAQVPIIPIGFWSSRNFQLNSWDSFLITLPFSKCSFTWSDPIEIPRDLNDEKILYFQDLIKNRINECIQKAKINCQ